MRFNPADKDTWPPEDQTVQIRVVTPFSGRQFTDVGQFQPPDENFTGGMFVGPDIEYEGIDVLEWRHLH
jgi:hypothetical protein